MKRHLLNFFWCLVVIFPLMYFIFKNSRESIIRGNSLVDIGRQVYEDSGCPVCHTMFMRNTVEEVIRFLPDDYLKWDTSTIAEMQRFRRRKLDMSGRRIGPDLENLSVSMRNDFYLENYIKDPFRLNKHSVMPAYENLFKELLDRDEWNYFHGDMRKKESFGKITKGDALVHYLKEVSGNGF